VYHDYQNGTVKSYKKLCQHVRRFVKGLEHQNLMGQLEDTRQVKNFVGPVEFS